MKWIIVISTLVISIAIIIVIIELQNKKDAPNVMYYITPVGCWSNLGSEDIKGKKLTITHTPTTTTWSHPLITEAIKNNPNIVPEDFHINTARNINDVAYLAYILKFKYFAVANNIFNEKVENFKIIFFNQLPPLFADSSLLSRETTYVPHGSGQDLGPTWEDYKQNPLVSNDCDIYNKRSEKGGNTCCGYPCINDDGSKAKYIDMEGNERSVYCGGIGYHTISDLVWSAWRIDQI